MRLFHPVFMFKKVGIILALILTALLTASALGLGGIRASAKSEAVKTAHSEARFSQAVRKEQSSPVVERFGPSFAPDSQFVSGESFDASASHRTEPAVPVPLVMERRIRNLKEAGRYQVSDQYSSVRHSSRGGLSRHLDQGGDDISQAMNLPSVPFSATGTTVGYQDDYDETCPYYGPGSPDVVYRYTPGYDRRINISLCEGSDFDTKLYVYENTVTPGAPYACNDDACPGLLSAIYDLQLYGGNTYYFIVDGYGGEEGNYTFHVTRISNDFCSVANMQGDWSDGYLEWQTDDELLYWLDPEDCDQDPALPFDVDSVSVTIADALAFGLGTYPGTLTFRLLAVCPMIPGDPCSGPDDLIWESSDLQYVTDGMQGLQTLTYAADLCLGEAVFFGLRFLSWDGAPDRVPTPVWDDVERPRCRQYICRTGCYDHEDFFVPPTNTQGWVDVTVHGRTDDPCAPLVCNPAGSCPQTCPPGGVFEDEPQCSDEYVDEVNGGCNSSPPAFGALSCGDTVCGSSGTFLVGQENMRDTDWYEIVLAERSLLTWSVLSEFDPQLAVIRPGDADPCTDYETLVSEVGSACDIVTASSICLDPGTYWLFVSVIGTAACGADYVAWLDCETCPPCIVDGQRTISCSVTEHLVGNTSGAGDDCPDGIEEELWELTVTEAGQYRFDGCTYAPGGDPCLWDGLLILWSDCCQGNVLCWDDDCSGAECPTGSYPMGSIECCYLEPGTYFLEVTGYQEGDAGAYDVAVDCCVPCVVDCPSGAEPEGEPACAEDYTDLTNGGCDADPVRFQSLSCGDTICGLSGSYLVDGVIHRESDWFEIVLDSTTEIVWSVVADFSPSTAIIMPGEPDSCGDRFVVAADSDEDACDTVRLSRCLPAGTHWLYVSPASYPSCEASYAAWIECRACEDCEILTPCGEPVETEPNGDCPNTLDPMILSCDSVIFGNICPTGDEDHYQWIVPNRWKAAIQSFSGENCDQSPPEIVIDQLDPSTCLEPPGREGSPTNGWTVIGPDTFIIRARGITSVTTGLYKITVFCDTVLQDPCYPDSCLDASEFTCDTEIVFNTCLTGCQIYDGCYEDSCQGSLWRSGPQAFLKLTVLYTDEYCFTVTGDSEGMNSTEDVQFMLFTDCIDPQSSCIYSQDVNYPGNEITGPGYTEQGCITLSPDVYYLGVSAYDALYSPPDPGGTCGPITVQVQCPPPCEPPADLRMAFDGSQIILFWNCSREGIYRIYSTENAGNDGNPDHGDDLDWTLAASLTLPEGPAQWIDSAPVVPYKNFVIELYCE